MDLHDFQARLLCTVGIYIMSTASQDIDTCIAYLNAAGDSEQILMDITNETDMSTGVDFSPLTRDPCAKSSRVHLTILPDDISGLSETPKRLQIVYDVAVFRNATKLQTLFRSVDISAFRNFRQINCWLGIPVSDHVIINVIVKVTGQVDSESKFLEGQLTIPSSDANTCLGPCQSSDIGFKIIYVCMSNTTLTHAAHVRFLRVTFTQIRGNASSLEFNSKDDQNTTIYLASIYDGSGRMEITYKDSGYYCSMHKDVRVFCDITTTTSQPDPKVDSFGTFVVFGLITMLVFTVIIFLIIFIVQKFNVLRQFCCNGKDKAVQDHHQYRTTQLTSNTANVIGRTALRRIGKINELVPLTTDNTPDNQNNGPQKVRTQSSSQSNSSLPLSVPTCVRKLQKSVTQALLQNMSSTSTSILLLPLPFDHFTRDIVELLGTVLSMEADILTRFCFDRVVQTEYYRDTNSYIKDLCLDQNKLLIFVCLTNLTNIPTNNSEEPNLIDNLLRNIVVQSTAPMCKIVFLHLTDDENILQNKYHGLDIHMKQENSFETFLTVVLKECGKNVEEHNLLHKMVNCEAAKHFLEYLKVDHP